VGCLAHALPSPLGSSQPSEDERMT
jgi:hypothetical protein